MTRLTQKDGTWWVEDSDGMRRPSDLEVELWHSLVVSNQAVQTANTLLEHPWFEEHEALREEAETYESIVRRLVAALDEAAGGEPGGETVAFYEGTAELLELHRVAAKLVDTTARDIIIAVGESQD